MKTNIIFKRYIKNDPSQIREIDFCSDGTKAWYLNRKYHREDGPSFIRWDGYKEWCLNGYTHREDGPACEYSDGTKYWYLNGSLHREDGPAVERSDGSKEWYLNGNIFLSEKEHREAVRIIQRK